MSNNGRCLLVLAVSAALMLATPTGAAAFTLSDGAEVTCTTGEGVAQERHHPPGDPAAPGGFMAFTHFEPGSGWIIDWNDFVLSSAPSEVHDLVFFHECAHAKTGTLDEVEANCLGLLDMRAAGRGGRAVEARLAAYHQRLGYMGPQYGLASTFWGRTLRCATSRAGKRANAKVEPQASNLASRPM